MPSSHKIYLRATKKITHVPVVEKRSTVKINKKTQIKILQQLHVLSFGV